MLQGGSIDIVYIGKKSSFTNSVGNFVPLRRRHIPLAGIPAQVAGFPWFNDELTDHHSEAFLLRVLGADHGDETWYMDPTFYRSAYGDLDRAFGNDVGGYVQHFHNHGAREGRVSAPWFDTSWYRANHADLAAPAWPRNGREAVDHYALNGRFEGRQGSIAFDPRWYLDQNADLRAAYGPNNYVAAQYHWQTYGLDEGRDGSPDFSPRLYL